MTRSPLGPADRLRDFASTIHLTQEDVAYLLDLAGEMVAAERAACAAIAREQGFFPDTKLGRRQQWVKDEIARKIVERGDF